MQGSDWKMGERWWKTGKERTDSKWNIGMGRRKEKIGTITVSKVVEVARRGNAICEKVIVTCNKSVGSGDIRSSLVEVW